MKIELINIDKVKPYFKNPRKNDRTIELLKESINKFGFNVPLVVDKNYVIITGHARYKALKQLAYKKIPVIIRDLDEKKAREYRLADNKIQETTEWDLSMLRKEIMDLDEIIGFEKEELEKIININNFNVSTDDIKKKEDEFSQKLSQNQDLNEVVCPYCFKTFSIQK